MRRHSARSTCFIAVWLMGLLTLPPPAADGCRAWVTAIFGSAWNWFSTLAVTSQPRRLVTLKEEIQRLQLENRQLWQQVVELRALLFGEQSIQQALISSIEEGEGASEVESALKRRRREQRQLIRDRLMSLPARVIYRSPTAWNSTLWLNVGEADNQIVGRTVVAKNSPVVWGASLVGVIDLVNLHQSRVRLVTDSTLVPAVRALHNGRLLAKGELHGSGSPLWRREGRALVGMGFNYDFADEEGPARDLRNGRPVGEPDGEDLPLIQVGDRLVTSGLDGVFPPGLQVAEVTAIQPLREGDYFYELEARPTAGDLDALSLLYVLPPVGFSN